MEESTLETSHGKLYSAISKPKDSGAQSTPIILFLHGNSSNSTIFKPLLTNASLVANYTLIIFDLPGHGQSSDAPDPEKSYHQPAYAEAALEVLQHYGVKDVIVIGWSLGGHNAIELIPILAGPMNKTGIRMLGMMAVGTPPCADRKQIAKGFYGDIHMSIAASEKVAHDDLVEFAHTMTKRKPAEQWLIDTTLRTDGRARRIMFENFLEGKGSDQAKVIEDWTDGWVAIVNGGAEPFVNLDYCDEICKNVPKLWKGKCIRVEGLEHGPFYENPEAFTPLFLEFVKDCTELQKD